MDVLEVSSLPSSFSCELSVTAVWQVDLLTAVTLRGDQILQVAVNLKTNGLEELSHLSPQNINKKM